MGQEGTPLLQNCSIDSSFSRPPFRLQLVLAPPPTQPECHCASDHVSTALSESLPALQQLDYVLHLLATRFGVSSSASVFRLRRDFLVRSYNGIESSRLDWGDWSTTGAANGVARAGASIALFRLRPTDLDATIT